MSIQFINWGTIPYYEAWEKQKTIFDNIIKAKKNNLPYTNSIIFCEHPHVYTLGKHGDNNNMLINEQFVKNINASFFKIDRGGDITYHGPGQLVCYPIINLDYFNIGLKKYIFILEESIIQTCKHYGVKGERLEKSTGVWIDVGLPSCRKISAIGVKSSSFVTMHGLAFNINTDLNYFNYINPCGFVDKGVTSLQKETNKNIDMVDLKNIFEKNISKLFQEL